MFHVCGVNDLLNLKQKCTIITNKKKGVGEPHEPCDLSVYSSGDLEFYTNLE